MPESKFAMHKKLLISLLAVLVLLGLGWRTVAVRAWHSVDSNSKRPPVDNSMNAPVDSPAYLTNDNCIMCHQSDRLKGITQDALQVNLTVNEQDFNQSVHGKVGILCVGCHTTYTTYPHESGKQVTCEQCHEQEGIVVAKLPHENRRMMEAHFNETCRNCHADVYSASSVHSPVAQRGEINTPLCTDCHGGHDIQRAADPPERVTVICSRCHTAVYTSFLAKDHYQADPLSQTCADCHTPHEVNTTLAEPTPAPLPTLVATSEDQSYLSLWNSTCTMCHAYPNLIGKAADETTISLTVTDRELSESVHGKAGLGCAACHQSVTGYPHQETEQVACSACHGTADPEAEIVASLPYDTTRAVSIDLNEACRTCHEDEYEASAGSMHVKSLKNGNLYAPLCVDCHGSHSVQSPEMSRASTSQSCAKCHESVYTSYQSSVHGVAVEKDGSQDAPTCADCHGVHAVSGPRQANFRSQSVATCASCHQNAEMMSRYGVSADLFNPNIDDFHGVALSLFNQPDNELASNTAVCYDCHGVHTIRKTDDPLSSVYPSNLLQTCQKCHPDAGSGFTGAGVGHSRSKSGAVTLLTGFERIYTGMILLAFGLLVIYILLDSRKRWAEKKELIQPVPTEK